MTQDIVYLRDIDGTGSMHVCNGVDPGSVAYVRHDLTGFDLASGPDFSAVFYQCEYGHCFSGTLDDGSCPLCKAVEAEGPL